MNKFEYFFSEDQARYIIELREENLKLVKKLLNENSGHYDELGLITKNQVISYGEPNFSDDEIKSALERDNFMTAEDAKKFGLIDSVVEKRK